jgi:hypothetical protein
MEPNVDGLEARIQRLERQLKLTRRITLSWAVFLAIGVMAAFRSAQETQQFEEIEVQRINVVEPDGRPALIIASSARMPGGIIKGREVATHRPPASGMLFYNSEGTEAGGLMYTDISAERQMAVMSLTFDQLNQDQVIALQYLEEDGRRRKGLQILDRPSQSMWVLRAQRDSIARMPEGEAKQSALSKWVADQGGSAYGAQRLYVGADENNASIVDLLDPLGRSRLRLSVDSTGTARIEFLNEEGRVTSRLPNGDIE